MEICATCKTRETKLYDNGVPICVKCATNQEAKSKWQEPSKDIHAALVQRLCQATTEAHHAGIEFNAIMDESPSGLPHPMVPNRVNNASRKLSAARKGMMNAHNCLNDFLARGIVPEDLKRSG